MGILSLPIEIIQLIGNDGLGRDRLRLNTLRLVCSHFNRAFEAEVLSTLVILVTSTTLQQSMEMLWTFATQDKKSSRAVQHARTLKIKYLSPVMALHPDLFRISQSESESHEPESQDLSPNHGPPGSLIRRLASAISSIKRRFKKRTKLTMGERHAIGEELMKEHLELAISSMKNLETVRWAVQIYDPSWTEAAVIRGLTRLPQLQDLQLIFNRHAPFERSVGQVQFKLDCLSGLKKISLSGNHVHRPHDIISGLAGLIAKSPQLVHLEVKLGHRGISPETPTLHDVLSEVPEDHPLQLTHLALVRTGIRIDSSTLPHLRSLISLDLRNLPDDLTDDADLSSERLERACSTSDICAILKQEGIYLKHVVVSDVGVFDYLCSYSGLETLDLCSFSFNTVEESNTAARTFFKFVLPQLVHSLQVLKIQPKHEGRWCFNPEDVIQSVVFSQCNKLRSLSVALKSTSFIQSIDHLDRVLHQYKDNLDDVISSLINLSLSLPTFSEICIVIPALAFESDVIIVNDSGMFYGTNVMELVTRSITRFSLHVGHNTPHIGQVLPDIWVDGKKLYQYQTQVDVERRRYMLTYQKPWDPYQYVEDNTAVMTTVIGY